MLFFTDLKDHRRLLLILALLAAGCGGGASNATPPADTAAPAKPAPPPGASEVVGRAPAKAVVVLEPKDPGNLAPAAEPEVMDQAGYTFYPALLLAQRGQRVEFRNSEDVLHNVRVAHSDTKEVVFNIATPPFGTYNHTFDKAGYYDVTCDVHPAMSANILVTTSPFAVVVDDTGSFSLPGVRPGAYTLTVYIGGERIERAVEVSAPRTELTVPTVPAK